MTGRGPEGKDRQLKEAVSRGVIDLARVDHLG